jgi:hypothetical protein
MERDGSSDSEFGQLMVSCSTCNGSASCVFVGTALPADDILGMDDIRVVQLGGAGAVESAMLALGILEG